MAGKYLVLTVDIKSPSVQIIFFTGGWNKVAAGEHAFVLAVLRMMPVKIYYFWWPFTQAVALNE